MMRMVPAAAVAGLAVMLAAPGMQAGQEDPLELELGDPWEMQLGPVVTMPEFGGAWVEDVDGDTVLHLWLTDTGADAEEAVVAALREAGPAEYDTDRVTVHPADYSHTQLAGWSFLALAVDPVTAAKVDHRHNRIQVGVADPDTQSETTLAALTILGVPAEAIHFTQLQAPSAPTGGGRGPVPMPLMPGDGQPLTPMPVAPLGEEPRTWSLPSAPTVAFTTGMLLLVGLVVGFAVRQRPGSRPR